MHKTTIIFGAILATPEPLWAGDPATILDSYNVRWTTQSENSADPAWI